MSPFSILREDHKRVSVCHTFLHGETILLAPLFPHSPFSDLRKGVTTPIIDELWPPSLEERRGAGVRVVGGWLLLLSKK
jgi:hypothetical protein